MSRALRICAHQGCPALVPRGRCPQHQTPHGGRSRDPEQARFYGSAEWKATRARVRREEPYCRMGCGRPTTKVDHIDGNWRNNARSNLRGLCTECEASRTGQQHSAKAARQADSSLTGRRRAGTPGATMAGTRGAA